MKGKGWTFKHRRLSRSQKNKIGLGCPGLEPGTNRLKAEYSTIELATRFDQMVCYFFFFATFFRCGWRKHVVPASLPFTPFQGSEGRTGGRLDDKGI
jgi:hypothetical protein